MKLIQFIWPLLICLPLNAQIITTVAGNGTCGYSGDGGPAISARLSDMYYCDPAFDNAGNMYIAQTNEHTIRRIDAAGTITTIAEWDGTFNGAKQEFNSVLVWMCVFRLEGGSQQVKSGSIVLIK